MVGRGSIFVFHSRRFPVSGAAAHSNERFDKALAIGQIQQMNCFRVFRITTRPVSLVFARSMSLMVVGMLLCSCSKTEPDKSAADYKLGTLISFAGAGNSQAYRVSGWSQPEIGFTWTEGNTAVLRFGGLPTGTPLQMKTNLLGLTKDPQLASQPVEAVRERAKSCGLECHRQERVFRSYSCVR